jgi:hypothetical protein
MHGDHLLNGQPIVLVAVGEPVTTVQVEPLLGRQGCQLAALDVVVHARCGSVGVDGQEQIDAIVRVGHVHVAPTQLSQIGIDLVDGVSRAGGRYDEQADLACGAVHVCLSAHEHVADGHQLVVHPVLLGELALVHHQVQLARRAIGIVPLQVVVLRDRVEAGAPLGKALVLHRANPQACLDQHIAHRAHHRVLPRLDVDHGIRVTPVRCVAVPAALVAPTSR